MKVFIPLLPPHSQPSRHHLLHLTIFLTPTAKFHSGPSHVPCLCLEHSLSLPPQWHPGSSTNASYLLGKEVFLTQAHTPLGAWTCHSSNFQLPLPWHKRPSHHGCHMSSDLRMQPLVGQGLILFNKLRGASDPRQGILESEVPMYPGLSETQRGMQEKQRSLCYQERQKPWEGIELCSRHWKTYDLLSIERVTLELIKAKEQSLTLCLCFVHFPIPAQNWGLFSCCLLYIEPWF